ncbi:MAG: alpha/beta hydrolase [Candidatus Wallbacteria bacterium]
MKQEKITIGEIPAIIYGEKANNVYLFIHGKDGSKEEAEPFAEIILAKDCQVLSIDLPGHGERKNETERFLPWIVVPELQQIWNYMTGRWEKISLRANSIGAWYAMLAFGGKNIVKSLFVSPILDMEQLIRNMMSWAGVSEDMLETNKIIPTSFGHTLSWDYFLYVKKNHITKWDNETKILYGTKDNLTERGIVDKFVKRFNCGLTIVEEGEHWFHTKEQLTILDNWIKENS